MTSLTFCSASFAVALRKESVDRNTNDKQLIHETTASLSARRAWIEIFAAISLIYQQAKSLSARRAWIEIAPRWRVRRYPLVALRKESVDRNYGRLGAVQHTQVALRKESVDRNYRCRRPRYSRYWSLSARRAWIEIRCLGRFVRLLAVALRKESVDRNSTALASMRVSIVALRKESVDRNSLCILSGCFFLVSLSARRAWIEITTPTRTPTGCAVALRKESVDRNMLYDTSALMKCVALRKESVDRNIQVKNTPKTRKKSLSARRAWIEMRTV